VENDETLAEAANREVQEETGLRVDRLVDVAYTYSFPLADRWRHLYAADVARIQEHVFLAEVPATAEPRIDGREHDAWQWCLLDEALSMLLWPKNKTALRRANARLRQPGH
jgi:8-oxo-dGTP pyrophosphatase MutT (NUDIX family)